MAPNRVVTKTHYPHFFYRLAECLACCSESPETDSVATSASNSSPSGDDDRDPIREDKRDLAPYNMLQSFFKVILQNKDIKMINKRWKLVL